MKRVLFILITVCTISCNKDKCTYTLNDRDYSLIPYEHNDTIIATIYYKTTQEQIQEKLIVGSGHLSTIDNEGSLGKPLCKGTFEVFELELLSEDEALISECIIDLRNASGDFSFGVGFQVGNIRTSFGMLPFELEGSSHYDKYTEYFSQLTIDGKKYEEVYLIKDDTALKDSLYYSSISGLIKLIYQDGVILFERK